MGAKRVRGIANDPMAPLTAMLVAAMMLLGTSSGEPTSDRTRAEATDRSTAASAAVGKAYTPRLVLSGAAEAGGRHEATAPACSAAAETRSSYRVAAVRVEAIGT